MGICVTEETKTPSTEKSYRLPDGRFIAGNPAGPGRPRAFTDPDVLWDRCMDYFTWVHETPLKASQVISFQGVGTLIEVPKMRAMTIGAMCLHIGISQETWFQYRKAPAFSEIVTRAEDAIRSQKFEGASAELLNPNIIARDLGLADKSELTGANGGPVQVAAIDASQLSDATLAELLAAKR